MQKIVVCEICGRQVSLCGLSKHLLWHKGEKACGFCGKPVYGGKSFCNHSCASKKHKNREGTGNVHFCICGKRVKTKFCSIGCQHKNEFDEYIRKWLNGEVSGGNKGERGIVSAHVRKWLYERAENKCEALLPDGSRCGWSRKNQTTGKIPLSVHHKDGNSENHSPENLQVLCPCCHSLTDNYGGSNRGKGRKGRKSGVMV